MLSQLEVCLASDQGPLADNCRIAAEHRVASIELCAGMTEGGLTPSAKEIRTVRAHSLASTRLMVMIRPRAGDFCYQPAEIKQMLLQIRQAADNGADGVVFGCLTAAGRLDHQAMQSLVHCSQQHQLAVTFHRAFDAGDAPALLLGELLPYQPQRILTNGTRWHSGQGIWQGVAQLQWLQQQDSKGVQWVFGGGLTPELLPTLQRQLQPAYWHFYSALLQQHRLVPERLALVQQLLNPQQGMLEHE